MVRDRRVVEQVDEVGQHARLVAAGPFPRGAGVLAELRLSAENIRLDQFGDYRGGGVVREQHRAAVFLVDDRRVTQQLQRFEDAGGGLQKLFAGGEILEIVALVGVRALQQHAVGCLGRSRDGDDVVRVPGAGNRTLGVQEVTVLDGETQRGVEVLQIFVGAILAGSLFEKMQPGSKVGS